MKNIKTKLFYACTIIFLVCFAGVQEPCGGNERWDVKTLQDAAVKKINLTPVQTTVEKLTHIVHTEKIGNTTPRFGFEFNCVQIDCRIREFRVEDDGDYHLVLVDLKDTSKTIIGEIPDPTCDRVKTSKFIRNFAGALKEFDGFKLPNNQVKYGVYTITGVCFFDKQHGQIGLSKTNGIELHPIMDIVKGK